MNWDALGAIAEMIGGLGVIATLAYLAVQIRNSNRQDNIRAVQDTVSNFADSYAKLTATTVDAKIFSAGLSDFSNLPQVEKAVFHSKMQLLAGGFYQVLAMKESGILTDEDLFTKSVTLFISIVMSPGGHEWWAAYRHLPPEPLKVFIEKQIADRAGELVPAHEDQVWYRLSGP